MFPVRGPKTGVMTHASRPLIGLLVATVACFAVWTVALKPSSSSSGGGTKSTGMGSYQSAIDKAHQSVKTSDAASAAHGGTVVTAPTSTTGAGEVTKTQATTQAKATPAVTAAPVTVSPAQQRANATENALRANKVVALLFYNPAAADDRAVKAELTTIPARGSQVVTIEVPLSEAGRYTFITDNIELDTSPTLLLIDRARQASTIEGYAARFEIAQRVDDALAAPGK